MKVTFETMKATFETEDEMESLRVIKSLDMALFIWELLNRGLKQFEESETIELEDVREMVYNLLEANNINIYELILK